MIDADAALLIAVAFGAALMPVFGPPGWAIVVWFRTTTELPAAAIVGLAAGAGVSGRFVLATTVRWIGAKLLLARLRRLRVAARWLARRPRAGLAEAAIFSIAPLPSGYLFTAAGLVRIPLSVPLASHFVGRLLTYSFYVAGAAAAAPKVRALIAQGPLAPEVIVVQVLVVAGIVLLLRVDWLRMIARRRRRRDAPPAPPTT